MRKTHLIDLKIGNLSRGDCFDPRNDGAGMRDVAALAIAADTGHCG
ncbi:MAG: hypothetical protein ACXVAY_21630 [Mucilaginibacter sp.]